MENQIDRVRKDRSDDVRRLEEKLSTARKEKIECSKDTEKMRLKLRASSREIDELRRQINILKSEEEWRKKELERLQQGAQAEIQSKEKKLSEALRHEEQKRKESERQAYQNHSSTIQEIEQLRRRNQDLAESVQSLTHALQTLTGSGEKRGHGSKKYAKSSKKNSLKRSRQDHDDIAIDRHSMYTPSSDSKFADKNGGKKSRPSSSSSNNGGTKKKKKKIGKDTARRNDITEALRRRGWRPSDPEDENIRPKETLSLSHNNGSMSPVMSHTSASKIRKLARQDSRSTISGNIGHGSAKRGLSAGSLPSVESAGKTGQIVEGPVSR